MKLKVICIISLIFHVSSALTQNTWKIYRTSTNDTRCIAISGDYIWCGTDYGAFQYNSKIGEIKGYTVEDGLIDNVINAITIGPDETIWLTSDDGISKYDGLSWQSIERDQIIPSSVYYNTKFYDICISPENQVWVASSKGIFNFNGEKWSLKQIGSFRRNDIGTDGIIWFSSDYEQGNNFLVRVVDSTIEIINKDILVFNNNSINDISIAPGDSVVWVLTDSSVVSYNNIRNTITQYSITPSNTLDIAKDGTVWLGNSNGVMSYSEGEVKQYKDDYNQIDSAIMDIACDSDGLVWFATETRLLSYDGSEIQYHTQYYSAGPAGNKILDIAIDHNNVKWFAQRIISSTGNASYASTSTFDDIIWNEIPELNYSEDIIVDHDNTIWIGTGNPLLKYENGVLYTYTTGNMEGIYDIIADENNVIWIADSGDFNYSADVLTFDGEKFTTVFENLTIINFALDSQNHIWMAGYKLYEYDGYVLSEYDCDDSATLFQNIVVDHDDVIWVCDEDRVYTFKNGEWDIYGPNKLNLPNDYNSLLSIEVDHNNTKWIGTDAGVCRFDGETWTTFTTENSGLCDNKVNAIAVEENNTIWFGTDNGVSKYTGETITTTVDEEDQTPETIPLIKTYPNPFNPSTTIEFTLPESGFAIITIYSMAGQKIRELNADFMPAGTHMLMWDGRDSNGTAVSSGIYITRLQAGKHTATGRMVLMK